MTFPFISILFSFSKRLGMAFAYRIGIFIAMLITYPALGHTKETAYHDQERHFSLTLPEGWCEMPYDSLQNNRREVAEITQSQFIHYITGFQLADSQLFRYPYMLIQDHLAASASFSEIEQMIDTLITSSASDSIQNELSELLDSLSFEQPIVDQKRSAIFIKMRGEIAEVGKFYGQTVLFLGRKRVIQLNCYCLADEVTQWKPVFQSMIASFAYDSGHEYDSSTNFERFWNRLDNRIIGIVLVIIIAIVINKFRRRKVSKEQ